ncbi:hypothetical protein HYV71_01350 [Candidatus Uhrbacteria bacterium]|nr:hypothetical protein [Candidatus Uhrbacteria bacterium]
MEKRAPFDPQSEVKKIRELSADEHALSREDRLAIRKERLHAFKELNTLQQEGIALCIRTLQRAITERPDVPIKELWNIVDDFSQKIRLSKRQKKLFIDTIALFEDSRSRVFALYRTYKEKPQELFARCFEFEPRGQIDLAHTPFMLYFKTHKTEDYIDAFLYQRTDVPPDPEESTDTPKHARQSAGFIKSGTGLKSPFTGIVAVEKGSTFNKNELLAHRESRDLAPFPAAIFIHLFEIKKIHITHENDNQILITCSDTPPKQPDMIGKRVVITADNTVLFDCTLVRKDDKKSIYSTPIDSETSALLMDDHAFWNHAYWRNTTATTKRERERLRHEPIIRIPNHD